MPDEVLHALETPLRRAIHERVPDPHRVDGYYAPIAVACLARLERLGRRPWILGMQGPQGCGKTTLATALAGAFGDVDVRALAVSIDDFYLTYDAQRALASAHPDNPYLRYRGYPGTHDIPLGEKVIDAIARLEPGGGMQVPRYSKALRGGRGDRAPSSQWTPVVGPVDLLVLEGWLLGFSPVDRDGLEPDLRAPNELLQGYAAWNDGLDGFLRIDPPSLEVIVDWRVDAERSRRAAGEEALTDAEARDYIERFLPAYRTYLPRLRSHPPCDDVMTVVLSPDRTPTRLSMG